MHIHILGICGTFMGGLAQLAAASGHRVTGQDAGVYPPMSTQLQQAGIRLHEGYDPAPLQPAPDMVVIGNALSRGNPAVEYVLDHDLPYTSGPQFLAEHVLRGRWVLGVAGTHGKTTTASLLAHILDACGLAPGFLIGGVPQGFGVSARLGDTPFFVIEADEYDTAFFDKRSKFVHYHPRTLVINNLEFDHADIFADLAAIQRQFAHLLRTVPGNGLVITSAGEPAIEAVIESGCWTPRERFALQAGADWQATAIENRGQSFTVICEGKTVGELRWGMIGLHNVGNALAALAAARHVGVPVVEGLRALAGFVGVKRRMELRGEAGGVRVYDDFAHHPTAIATTLEGARAALGGRILAVLEPRSNTLRMGVHRAQLAPALAAADAVFLFEPAGLGWSLDDVAVACAVPAGVYREIPALVTAVLAAARPGDHVLIMSNGAFGGIHELLLGALADRS